MNDKGLKGRRGHTEASVDLCQKAGFNSVGVICEILNEDGTMARGDDLVELAEEHNLKIITLDDILDIQPFDVIKVNFPTKHGTFELHTFNYESEHHLAVVKGSFSNSSPTFVRIHSECLTGDVFGSQRCDCGEQLDYALKELSQRENGIIIYLRQEGRGIGLVEKMKAYQLQEKGLDTFEANLELGHEEDSREYNVAVDILNYFKISNAELMTHNPHKRNKLIEEGIKTITTMVTLFNLIKLILITLSQK